MQWLKNFASTPFSDLWLPSILIGAAIIALLGLHHLWLAWRVQRLSRQVSQAPAASPALTPSQVPGTSALSDIHAFTAQRQPVALEEQPNIEVDYVPTAMIVPEHLEPSFDAIESFDDSVENDSAEQRTHCAANGVDEAVFFKPHATVLLPKPAQPATPALHPVMHYQAKLDWSDVQGKQVLPEVLQTYPWAHTLPVVIAPDEHDDRNVILGWLVASRRQLSTSQDAQVFKQWCEQLASAGAGRCEMLSNAPWDTFLDQAHALLIGLDSVIVLKIAVPLVQLDLFAQSLLAARFTQHEEHWRYQEQPDSTAIYLERLWQQTGAQAADDVQAVFQVVIDIPHLDTLEARKIYMRLRAVARASASIVQSAQGVHLSEGMLDRYSRELMMKQEALAQAQVPPGSALAKQVYAPQLVFNRDLGLA